MPTLLPESPRLANGAEQVVWDALREQCGSKDLLVAGQRVTNHAKDFEIDVVAVLDGAGIVTIEVKGGDVWHDGQSWRQRHGPIDPVGQVRGAKYALRSYLESDPRWGRRGRVRWAHLVVLPHAAVEMDFALPDCPRWSVVDRTQLGSIAELARDALRQQASANRCANPEDVEVVQEVLGGRMLPQRDVVARAMEHEDAADRLTEAQSSILSATRALHRIEVRGGAGSGKTYLACEQARRLTREGQRVALLCYSHGLASYLRRLCAEWPRNQRPAYVGELHELGMRWGADEGPPENSDEAPRFFEQRLPQQMTELAEALPPGRRFDAVVVDEAQDFADSWWYPVLAALKDPERSGLYVFSDEGQRVFERYGSPPVPLVPLILDANLRNTRPIAESFTPLAGQRMRLQGGEGPAVRFVPCSSDDAVDCADDAVEALLEAGWRPEDVALLTTGSRHPEQKERQQQGHEAYWDSFWDSEQVFYGHVLGFKGLERRAVALAVNSLAEHSRIRERLYVGLSRARDQLVVCADPQLIRRVGGAELARRLGVDD